MDSDDNLLDLPLETYTRDETLPVARDRRQMELELLRGEPCATVFQTLGPPSTPATPPVLPARGLLERLPAELFFGVCRLLDVHSALRLSHAGRRLRQRLAAIPEFRLVGQHASASLWLVLRAGLGAHIRPVDLHAALRTRSCCFCGGSGGFLLVLTAQRCCYGCIRRDDHLRLHTAVLLSPATRTCHSRVLAGPVTVRPESLLGPLNVRSSFHHIYVAPPQAVAAAARQLVPPHEPYYRTPTVALCRPWSTTRLPFYDPATDSLDHGTVRCGCFRRFGPFIPHNGGRIGLAREIYYSGDAFWQHVRGCPDAYSVGETAPAFLQRVA